MPSRGTAGRSIRSEPRLRGAGRLDEAVAKLDLAARVDPGWPGTPLIAAVRELTERARLVPPGNAPTSARAMIKPSKSDLDSGKLQNEIRKTNAAWQYELEALLLGRELDASRASSNNGSERASRSQRK